MANVQSSSSNSSSLIIDIGGSRLHEYLEGILRDRVMDPSLSASGRQCLFPSALLSSDEGIRIWQKVTRLPHYYPSDDEKDNLALHGTEIASYIQPGTVLIDLGCGDVRKVRPLLDKLELAKTPIHYFGLDLSQSYLNQGIASLSQRYEHIQCNGLWGTFDDCRAWIASGGLRNVVNPNSPKWFLSLGSILGNDSFDSGVSHLRKWAQVMTSPHDRIFLGVDATSDPRKVYDSYNDHEGVLEQFMRRGLEYSNQVLGREWYRPEDWQVSGVITCPKGDDDGQPLSCLVHKFVFKALKEVSCPDLGVSFPAGFEMDCWESFKFGPEGMKRQFEAAGLIELGKWNSFGSSVYNYLVEKAA
ncbi:Histidine-specific methyltransferase, SAM-dependent domain containing protein [Rhypophila decipiens]